MKEKDVNLEKLIGSQLESQGYDLVDLISIPSHGDRMVRVRTLQEALEEFDGTDSGDMVSYVVQVRPKSKTVEIVTVQESATASAPAEALEAVEENLSAAFLFQNADLLFSSGDFSLALNIYRAILQRGESQALALYWMGRCHEAEGRVPDARKCYEDSITWQPRLDTYQFLSSLLIRQGQDKAAAQVLERALNLKGLDEKTRCELFKACGNCWMRAETPERAEKNYRKVMELDPRADDVLANLGALYLQMGRTEESRRFFEDALASNPSNDKALAGIGSCWLAEGEKRKAHDFFARALSINLNNPSAIFYLVKCAYEIKSYATAARILSDYADTAPVNANLLYSLAGLQFHLGRRGEAKATAQKILELQPQHPGAAELMKLITAMKG